MTTAHAPEGVTPSTAPEQGTDTAVKTAENAHVADEKTVSEEKLDVADLRTKVEDPTVGNADELRDFTADEVRKDDAAESGAGSMKVPEPDAEMQEQIKAAQEAINKLQEENPKPPQGNVEDLVLGKLKAAPPPQDHVADDRPPRYFPPPQDHVADDRPPRHFPLDRRNRDERRGKNRDDGRSRLDEMDERVKARRKAELTELDERVGKLENISTRITALPSPFQAQTPKPPVAATQSTPKTAPVQVQNVVTPVPPPEDTEVANLRAQAARSNKETSERVPWSDETKRRVVYGLMAFAAVLLTVWGFSHFFGDSKKTTVPNVPVEVAKAPLTKESDTASKVLLDKLTQMENRLAEALPTQADLAFLDSKITEAENAAVTQIAHVPCFKDPNQKRCVDAVKTERVYYESDFSHPRDVALGKIPYKKTTDKPAPKKASEKVTKK